MDKQVAIIVAVDQTGGFGKDGKIPWHFPEDLANFKRLTAGSVCVMGRRTYEDMLNMRRARDKEKGKKLIKKILPGRDAYVISRTPSFTAPGATVISDLRSIFELEDQRPVFLLGGYRLFVEGFNWIDHVFMTIIKGRYDCDRFFPIQLLNRKFAIVDGTETDQLYFVTYQRRGSRPWGTPSQKQGDGQE